MYACLRLRAKESVSQYVGDMAPFKHWCIGRNSLARVSSWEIQIGQDVTVVKDVLNSAAALDAEIDLNLGPPYL